jgi:hypothetical protein
LHLSHPIVFTYIGLDTVIILDYFDGRVFYLAILDKPYILSVARSLPEGRRRQEETRERKLSPLLSTTGGRFR